MSESGGSGVTLQCVAVCSSVLQCVAVCCSVLQCVAVCCSALQCVAVCCSVLQCDAVCCSVLCSVVQPSNTSVDEKPFTEIISKPKPSATPLPAV